MLSLPSATHNLPSASLTIRTHIHDWYREVRRIRELVETLVATAAAGKKPQVAVDLPEDMTPIRLRQIFRRMYATTRHNVYTHMRKAANLQRRPLSKQQLIQIAESARKGDIRESICEFYGIKKTPDDRFSFILRRAYYTFMTDQEFGRAFDADKADNDRLLTVIFEGWVVPGMESSPGQLSEDDLEVPSSSLNFSSASNVRSNT